MAVMRFAIFGIIGIGLVAGLFSVGVPATFGVFVLIVFVFGGIVTSNNAHDPKIAVNGEILQILQGYTDAGARVLWGIKAGTACWDEYHQVKAAEENFREVIEIDPNDDRCIYRYRQ